MKKPAIYKSLVFTLLLALLIPAGAARSAYRAQSAGALLLGEVVFTGNENVPTDILREALSMEPGDTISVAALARARLDVLYSHHLVRDVRVSTRPGPRLGIVDVVMEIEERSRVAFETGFGYHDIYGWFLTVAGIRWRPVARDDSMWRAGVRIGFHLTGLDAEWEKPGLLDTGAGAGARFWVYNQEHLFFGSAEGGPAAAWRTGEESEREYRQDIARAGAELFLLYRQRRNTRFTFGLRAESVDPDSTVGEAETGADLPASALPPEMLPYLEKTAITGFQFRMIHDTRDISVWPRKGSFINLSIQSNTKILGGDEIFSKAEIDTRFYRGIGGWRAVSYSIRGFRELSLSPPWGHDGFWLGGFELRVPLISSPERPPRLTGLLFLDAGQGWLRGEALTASDIESAVGYGFRVRLPWLGMLGLDVGIPLTEGKTGDAYRVHASFGFSY
jgi:outer membrane protein assembly factor BamA